MPRRLRFLPEGSGLVEITVRCVQSRLLLRPSPALRRIFIGCLARAQELHPVDLHAFCCLSNHFHLLLSGETSKRISDFMAHLNTNLSKEVGRLHDWPGPLFERRHQRIPVSDEPKAQIARLRYILEQGTKEGLVARPTDWPGAHSTGALLGRECLEGIWRDRTKEYAARQRAEPGSKKARVEVRYPLVLKPLPCWKHLPGETVQRFIQEIVDDIEHSTALRHQAEGTRPLGPRALLLQHPHQRPKKTKRSPAPFFHTASRRVLRELFIAYQHFFGAFREAAERLKQRTGDAGFPEGSFPPALPFVPP